MADIHPHLRCPLHKNPTVRAAYLRNWKAKRAAAGLCYCGEALDPTDSRKTCAGCRAFAKAKYDPKGLKRQHKYHNRVVEKLCTDCGQPIDRDAQNCTQCSTRKRPAQQARRQQVKQIVLQHYGTVCACCGENQPEFLQVDHINNDGAEHRRTDNSARQIWSWLIRHHFPPGFQLLCANCNYAKRFGPCPHITEAA